MTDPATICGQADEPFGLESRPVESLELASQEHAALDCLDRTMRSLIYSARDLRQMRPYN